MGTRIANLLRNLVDFFGSLWVLASLAMVSKLRFTGRYWTWRMNTAFPESTLQRGKRANLRSILEYARWAWRIRRLR